MTIDISEKQVSSNCGVKEYGKPGFSLGFSSILKKEEICSSETYIEFKRTSRSYTLRDLAS
jgi:hypothetical protein